VRSTSITGAPGRHAERARLRLRGGHRDHPLGHVHRLEPLLAQQRGDGAGEVALGQRHRQPQVSSASG